jgi:hypothetical protein
MFSKTPQRPYSITTFSLEKPSIEFLGNDIFRYSSGNINKQDILVITKEIEQLNNDSYRNSNTLVYASKDRVVPIPVELYSKIIFSGIKCTKRSLMDDNNEKIDDVITRSSFHQRRYRNNANMQCPTVTSPTMTVKSPTAEQTKENIALPDLCTKVTNNKHTRLISETGMYYIYAKPSPSLSLFQNKADFSEKQVVQYTKTETFVFRDGVQPTQDQLSKATYRIGYNKETGTHLVPCILVNKELLDLITKNEYDEIQNNINSNFHRT